MPNIETGERPKVERLAYTIKEACQASTYSEAHIYRLMASGKLRYSKAGRRTVIPASALRNLIEGEAA